VNGNVEVRKAGFAGMWRELTTEPAWKYEELPPVLLGQLAKRDLFEVGDTELARAHWFWSRRPKLTFHKSAARPVVGLCVLLSVAIALVAWHGTSIPERVAEMIILLVELAVGICLIVQRIRFVRWRREYERSIDRLIRTIHPGCEGGSAIER